MIKLAYACHLLPLSLFSPYLFPPKRLFVPQKIMFFIFLSKIPRSMVNPWKPLSEIFVPPSFLKRIRQGSISVRPSPVPTQECWNPASPVRSRGRKCVGVKQLLQPDTWHNRTFPTKPPLPRKRLSGPSWRLFPSSAPASGESWHGVLLSAGRTRPS